MTLKPFRHILLLPAIIFVFFDSVNAFKDNMGASNPVIEAVFDLLVTVLVPLILFIDTEKKELKESPLLNRISEKNLSRLQLLPHFTVIAMYIWFCVKAYQTTHDLFFIAYFVSKLVFTYTLIITWMFLKCIFKKNDRKLISIVIGTLLSTYLNIIIDFIFLFIAVRRDYVDKSTLSFVLVPIIIASFAGILMFACKFFLDDEAACKNVGSQKALSREILQKFERGRWIRDFCEVLLECTIVGPSVLWIKAFVTLKLMAYIIEEQIKKVKELKKQRSEIPQITIEK
ncbi:8096_t:CDS:1 [Funneliformis caledonium]|uniref:8096_t:CDS:1 n=1 Tax=Funneliformis caledonium TaxID=1117310 RepID=A0A9N8ZRI4_9GLOM|nr:8096_t:CDS:1 [Funneliformis caledonium]